MEAPPPSLPVDAVAGWPGGPAGKGGGPVASIGQGTGEIDTHHPGAFCAEQVGHP